MTVYRNACVLELDPPRVEAGVDLAVDRGLFAAVEKGFVAPGGAGSVSVDLGGAYVMPGLVCAHDHVYSALARGITARIPDSSSFVGQLQALWWRLDRALDEPIVRASALVAALEAVACGTTAIVDHHASPAFISGSLSVIRDAFSGLGMRGVLCYEVTDRNGQAGAAEGIAENLAFAREVERERVRSPGAPCIEACIGAHAPFTLSDATLERLGAAVAETGRGLHIHVAEDAYDVSFAHHTSGRDPVARLDGAGLLGERTILVHGVHLGRRDIELLNERDAFLVHNPRSNMANAVGYAGLLPGVRNVALGTDGIGADMFAESAAAYSKGRDAGLSFTPAAAGRLLARGNEVLSRAFRGRYGRIQPGYAADFVVLDYEPPTPLTAENVCGHLIFGISARHVRSVVIAGERIYTDRRFRVDAAEVYARARAEARRLWERMEAL